LKTGDRQIILAGTKGGKTESGVEICSQGSYADRPFAKINCFVAAFHTDKQRCKPSEGIDTRWICLHHNSKHLNCFCNLSHAGQNGSAEFQDRDAGGVELEGLVANGHRPRQIAGRSRLSRRGNQRGNGHLAGILV
jgi:hypothetical protein